MCQKTRAICYDLQLYLSNRSRSGYISEMDMYDTYTVLVEKVAISLCHLSSLMEY